MVKKLRNGNQHPYGAKHSTLLLVICSILGLLVSVESLAQDETNSGTFQIEYTLNQLLGEAKAEAYGRILPPDELNSWVVYLPDNDAAEKPGVLVYVSPRKLGTMDPRWRSVMDEQNLIYISADNSGNRVLTNRRMVLAVMAIRALAREHAFDLDKVMVSGFSGGGRVASILATQYPEVFSGALYICGVDFWKKDKTPRVERVLQNRFVFLTGTRDFNLDETRRVHRRYVNAGAEHSKLMVIPGMGHAHPDAKALTEALLYLNDRG